MDFKILSEKLHSDQKIRVVAHLVFWVLQFLLSWYLTAISFNIYSSFHAGVLALLALAATLNLVLVYYPLVYYVLPKLRQGRYLFAVLSILLLLFGYTLVNTISEELILNRCASCMLLLKGGDSGFYQFLHTPWPNRIFAKLVSFGMFFMLAFSICIPLAIKIGLQSFRQELTTMKLAKENVELEFNFLKSQVNPHFLFNSLNNIYGLILKKENAKAATTVARLSEFMRYSLYNSTNNKMPLSRELQLLKDYVELEQIRLNFTKVELDLAIERDDYDFPTLLLMPVVENAFKYSADILGAYIHIQLKIRDDKLVFKVENTVDVDRQLQSTGGIGLQNLKKRLNLYYPDRHHYEQGLSETMYVAQININL